MNNEQIDIEHVLERLENVSDGNWIHLKSGHVIPKFAFNENGDIVHSCISSTMCKPDCMINALYKRTAGRCNIKEATAANTLGESLIKYGVWLYDMVNGKDVVWYESICSSTIQSSSYIDSVTSAMISIKDYYSTDEIDAMIATKPDVRELYDLRIENDVMKSKIDWLESRIAGLENDKG